MKILTIILLTVMADISTKWWAHTEYPDISLIGNWLSLTHVKNTGIAFGTPLPYINIIIPCILIGMLYYIIKSWKEIPEQEKIGYTLIFTGGVLNALERAISGSVTDFISIQYFAVCNIADIAISGGVALLILSRYFLGKNTHQIHLQNK